MALPVQKAMTDKIVLFTTCASAEEGEHVAHALVEARLAACVNIVPQVRSIYRWKDAIEESAECLLLIKSSRPLLGSLRAALEKLHSYELPELIAIAIVEGSEPYLAWMERELRPQ